MNKIGALGNIVFVVSEEAIRTFSQFSRATAGRWAKHDVFGNKPLTQRIGPGLDTISFSMRFDLTSRINPRKELDALVDLERDGRAVPLVIGGKPIGSGLWIVTNVVGNWEEVDSRGLLIRASANVSLEEYVAVVKR